MGAAARARRHIPGRPAGHGRKQRMDVDRILDRIKRSEFYRDQVVAAHPIPARAAVTAAVDGGLHPAMEQALAACGITGLYSHQAAAINAVRRGKNVVVVTGTASGKTLCYAVPVAEAFLSDPLSTALCIYPTKALAQDQLRGFAALAGAHGSLRYMAGTYDGDTPQNLRRRLRDNGSVILTNPDMLHQGVLPQHARWNRFFARLRYVVIDEIHAYRGVFGSHLANVITRLRRICAHYGSSPQFICCSATINNPKEHAEGICGAPVELVDNDGSPRGPKLFVLWNPPLLGAAAKGPEGNWRASGDRRSPLGEAVKLMATLVKEEIQTIAFARTRLAAELIFKSCREMLLAVSPALAAQVHAYRGGYLPQERREIERRLAHREILGVSSTNALELGIDIGSLDACILVGYPGTIASLWQQAGRAGRGLEASVVFLCAQNSPMDQYLMSHPGYLFGKSPEQAVIDPGNPHIVVGHLKCAAQELPLGASEAGLFGPYAGRVLKLLEEEREVSGIEGRWYWSSSDYPAAGVNLRNIAGPVFTIQDSSAVEKVIGTLDELSAPGQLHDHAVYLHGAETYFVNKLDLDKKIAFVEKRDLDYYTQSVQTSQIRIDGRQTENGWRGGLLGFGDVTVVTSIPMFKKIKFHSRDSLGFEPLELPEQSLETVTLWFAPPQEAVEELRAKNMLIGGALIGIANVLVEVAPLFVMCDTQDIGAVVDAHNLGRDALFVHDKYPGGMGYARRCLERFDEIMRTIADVVRECPCPDGCPSCVGSAISVATFADLDSATRGRIPDKKAARMLLNFILNS
jgi:DEAD/DEAH box helicase domain-containing protein